MQYLKSFDAHSSRQSLIAGVYNKGQYVKIAGRTARFCGVYKGQPVFANGATLTEVNERFVRICVNFGF